MKGWRHTDGSVYLQQGSTIARMYVIRRVPSLTAWELYAGDPGPALSVMLQLPKSLTVNPVTHDLRSQPITPTLSRPFPSTPAPSSVAGMAHFAGDGGTFGAGCV